MTVFNFPDTSGKPTDGSFTWTAPSGVLYVWNGEAWVTQGGGSSGGGGEASISVTDDLTTITDPNEGDLAYHSVEARLYVYYQDDDSQQWVDASPAGDANDSGGDSLWNRVGSTLSPAFAGDDINVGAGTFSGHVQVGNSPLNAANNGAHINTAGLITLARTVGTDACFRTYTAGTNIPTSAIYANGAHTIGGDVAGNNANITLNADGKISADKGEFYSGTLPPSTTNSFSGILLNQTAEGKSGWINVYKGGIRVFDNNGVTSDPNITLNADGQGVFYVASTAAATSVARFLSNAGGTRSAAMEVRANGDCKARGAFQGNSITFRLEPDDPANFDAEGEYTGPTLDVKDRILNLISRLDAIEANEQIDDATDTSLLQLVASASARLDSIEARLTALEGGN